jgi:hypothetical protein
MEDLISTDNNELLNENVQTQDAKYSDVFRCLYGKLIWRNHVEKTVEKQRRN